MGSRRDRKVLYRSIGRNDRITICAMGIFLLFGAALLACDAILRFGERRVVLLPLLCIPAFLVYLSWIMIAIRGLTIYEWGLVVPTGALSVKPYKVLPFSEISEVRLNTGPEGFRMNVEIVTIHQEVIPIPKGSLKDWHRFYSVLQGDLKGRARIVI
jgi:hypothetical protein